MDPGHHAPDPAAPDELDGADVAHEQLVEGPPQTVDLVAREAVDGRLADGEEPAALGVDHLEAVAGEGRRLLPGELDDLAVSNLQVLQDVFPLLETK